MRTSVRTEGGRGRADGGRFYSQYVNSAGKGLKSIANSPIIRAKFSWPVTSGLWSITPRTRAAAASAAPAGSSRSWPRPRRAPPRAGRRPPHWLQRALARRARERTPRRSVATPPSAAGPSRRRGRRRAPARPALYIERVPAGMSPTSPRYYVNLAEVTNQSMISAHRAKTAAGASSGARPPARPSSPRPPSRARPAPP